MTHDVFITGGTGYLGRPLTEQLIAQRLHRGASRGGGVVPASGIRIVEVPEIAKGTARSIEART
jgi:nucleoside-diphosphate-sugar epimerase